jgi:hypothetical protein
MFRTSREIERSAPRVQIDAGEVSQNDAPVLGVQAPPNAGVMIDIQDLRLDPLAIASATDCPNRVHPARSAGSRTPCSPSGRSGASRASGQTGLRTIASALDRHLGAMPQVDMPASSGTVLRPPARAITVVRSRWRETAEPARVGRRYQGRGQPGWST